MEEQSTQSKSEPERRRSQRVFLSVPVLVRGEAEGSPTFVEETRTLVVSAHGALITLAKIVKVGEPLRLRNLKTMEERPCQVAHVGPILEGKNQIGVEFFEPSAHFWHIAFPPEESTPARPRSHEQPDK